LKVKSIYLFFAFISVFHINALDTLSVSKVVNVTTASTNDTILIISYKKKAHRLLHQDLDSAKFYINKLEQKSIEADNKWGISYANMLQAFCFIQEQK